MFFMDIFFVKLLQFRFVHAEQTHLETLIQTVKLILAHKTHVVLMLYVKIQVSATFRFFLHTYIISINIISLCPVLSGSFLLVPFVPFCPILSCSVPLLFQHADFLMVCLLVYLYVCLIIYLFFLPLNSLFVTQSVCHLSSLPVT